jgi:hypothetical protein
VRDNGKRLAGYGLKSTVEGTVLIFRWTEVSTG